MSGKSKGNHRPDFRCDAVRPTSGASGASLCTENLCQGIKRYAADPNGPPRSGRYMSGMCHQLIFNLTRQTTASEIIACDETSGRQTDQRTGASISRPALAAPGCQVPQPDRGVP